MSDAIFLGVNLEAVASIAGMRRAEFVRRLLGDGRREEYSFDRFETTQKEEDDEEKIIEDEAHIIALITAARRRPRKIDEEEWIDEPKELLEIGGRSVILHSLRSLEEAGIRTTIIVVGYRGATIIRHVKSLFPSRRHRPGRRRGMRVEIVDLGDDWAGTHAESILQARATMLNENMVTPSVPVLLVTSDHLFDPALLEEMSQKGLGDALLIEDRLQEERKSALPSTAVLVRTILQSRSQVKDDEESDALFWCDRVSRRLEEYDGYDAGLARAETARIWIALDRLARRQPKSRFALCDALDVLARKRQLRAVLTHDRPWIALETEAQYKSTKKEISSLGGQSRKGAMRTMVRASISENNLAALAAVESALTSKCSNDSPSKYNLVACNGLARSHPIHLDEETHLLDDITTVTNNDGIAIGVLVIRSDTDTPKQGKEQVYTDLAAYALVPNELTEECIAINQKLDQRHHPDLVDQFFSAGLDDSTDLLSVAVEATADIKDHTHLAVRIERSVPVVGWLVLAIATILQASGALVFDALDRSAQPPSQDALGCWRPLAASIAVIPLIIGTRFATSASTYDKNSNKFTQGTIPALILGIITFWISNNTYVLAFALARSPNDVVLATSLTPLFVVIARGLKLFGELPSYNEVKGTFIALSGAVLCALAGGRRNQDADESSQPLVALMLCLICVAAHAVYSMTTKICRTDFSAPILHLLFQLGSALIAILFYILNSLYQGKSPCFGFDPTNGIFGFLSPSRIAVFTFSGFGVDTLGTFGYVMALRYVDPLLTTVATLFQPLCAAFEAAAYYADSSRIPPIGYYIGTIFLIYGSALIIRTQAHTSRLLDVDTAIIQKQKKVD